MHFSIAIYITISTFQRIQREKRKQRQKKEAKETKTKKGSKGNKRNEFQNSHTSVPEFRESSSDFVMKMMEMVLRDSNVEISDKFGGY